MKRSLAIVLLLALTCAAGAWLLSRRSTEPLTTDLAPEPLAPRLPQEAQAAPALERKAARAGLSELVTIPLAFDGPTATLELRIVAAASKDPVPEVAVSLWAASPGVSPSGPPPGADKWEELTDDRNPPLADGDGRIGFRVPADRALAVELSGTWVRTEPRRHVLAALAPDEKRLHVLEVATEDDLPFFGIALDAATNAPLADVEIRLDRRPAFDPIATSDANGRFDLRTNSWGARGAKATKRGFAPLAFEVDDEHDALQRPQRLALTRSATIEGFYLEVGGRPIPEASLRFWTDAGFAAHVYCDERGWFEADSLPTGTAVKVDLELEHRTIARTVASLELAPAEVRRSDFELPARFPLHGTVLDELGAPVAGAEIALLAGTATDLRCFESNPPLEERDTCTTDEQGRFSFTRACRGEWVVELLRVKGRRQWGRRQPYSPHPLAAQNVTLGGPETPELLLRCLMHTTIQGRVVDADDHPVPGGLLQVQLGGCQAGTECPIAVNGRFSVDVPSAEEYELRVPALGMFLASEPVRARGGARELVLRVERAPLLRLDVIASPTQKPEYALVYGIGRSASGEELVLGAHTDPRGHLFHPQAVGEYRLFARGLDGLCGTLEGVRVEAGSPARVWKLSLAPAKRVILRSSNATGTLEVELRWNGIPADEQDLERGSELELSFPPGPLLARYRLLEPEGAWQSLETPVDDAQPIEIDLRLP